MTRPRLAFAAPAWRLDYLVSLPRPRRWSLLKSGAVTYLPPPIAGYRIRHSGDGAVIEIVPRSAPAMEVGRYPSAEIARAAMKAIWREHTRPILPEIGGSA